MGGYRLADTQFVTDHLIQFGAEEVPRHVYKRRLAEAIAEEAVWDVWPKERAVSGEEVLTSIARQT
jgi:leucyl/phenylalanyl-tRNA--protein transferase